MRLRSSKLLSLVDWHVAACTLWLAPLLLTLLAPVRPRERRDIGSFEFAGSVRARLQVIELSRKNCDPEKKPTRPNALRYSVASAYFSTSPPAELGYSSSSLPTNWDSETFRTHRLPNVNCTGFILDSNGNATWSSPDFSQLEGRMLAWVGCSKWPICVALRAPVRARH